MGIIYTFLASIIVWVVLWSLGTKALDGMLLVILIMTTAAAVKIIWPFLPGNREQS